MNNQALEEFVKNMKFRVIKDNKYFLYKYVPQYFDEGYNTWRNFEYVDCGEVKIEQFLREEAALNYIKERGQYIKTPEVVWEGEL